MALLAGATESVRAHLRAGAHVDATDSQGRPALMLALSRGHLDVCRLLLEAGADPKAKDQTGNDALGMARARGQTAIEELLEHAQAAIDESQNNSVERHSSNGLLGGQATRSHHAPLEIPEQMSAHMVASTRAADLSHQRDPGNKTSYEPPTEDSDDFDLSVWEEESSPSTRRKFASMSVVF